MKLLAVLVLILPYVAWAYDESIPRAEPSPSVSSCASDQFLCSSGECIYADTVCDGEVDCGDGSDEEGCQLPTHYCCHGDSEKPLCIPNAYKCDGQTDCPEGDDEEDCVRTVDGDICHLPFTYKGKSYDECITTNKKPWCSLNAEYSEHGWEYCE